MTKRNELLLAWLLYGALLSAQITGEIRGKVLDENGEPLPYVSVVTELASGTMAVETDPQGRFILKPLQPGSYQLDYLFLNYQRMRIGPVNVQADKITFLDDQRMVPANGLPEMVVVHWTRKLIDPEEPGRMSLLASELEHDPNRRDPVKLIGRSFAGVTPSRTDEGLHFRGSRSDNMAYFVDGVKVTGRLTGVAAGAIGSITGYTGGLPARYGDVTGGVVAIETKSYMDVYSDRAAR